MSRIISLDGLRRLAADFAEQGGLVVAPFPTEQGSLFYQLLPPGGLDRAVFQGDAKPANSIKEFFFPRHEVLYTFERKGTDVELFDAAEFSTPQLILGARPCDAAALPILDPLFAWGEQDRFYQSRREKSVVVTMACTQSDTDCFCSAVGGSPDNTAGSDAILFDLGEGLFEVRTLTDSGDALFDGQTETGTQMGAACAPPPVTFNAEKVRAWIAAHFDDPFWGTETLRCVGCGACTAVCPTCHCFDILDEGSYRQGRRVKNWDYCQSALFTLHASGHNPRPDQGARQRQRLMHKFSIYPEKFGTILCTGCGNCTRDCSTGLGVRPLLERIDKKS